MARKTKIKKIEVEVEEALKQALDFDFNSVNAEPVAKQKMPVLDTNPEHLAEEIAIAAKELAQEKVERITSNLPQKAGASAVNSSVINTPKQAPTGGTVEGSPSINLHAANDTTNDKGIRPSLFQLHPEQSVSRLYWGTTALSSLWAAGGAFIANHLAPAGLSSLTAIGNFLITPTGFMITAGTLAPILLFWSFAQLAKRATQLQNIASMITDAALRISDPYSASSEQMMAVSHTVRQEVALMNEGIERTLSRAVELEALMQGEVQNLQRAYAENESRIHTLMKELNNEREAILNHAARVQSTIVSTQDQLNEEFGAIASTIASDVGHVAKTLAETLQKQGEELIAKLSYTGNGLTKELVERYNNTARDIEGQNERLFDNLEKRFSNLREVFDKNGKLLTTTFHESATDAELLAQQTAQAMRHAAQNALDDFDARLKHLDDAIIDRGNQTLANFDEKLLRLDDLKETLAEKLDDTTNSAIEAFEKRLAKVDISLSDHSTSIIESFVARAQSLGAHTKTLDTMLEARALEIDETLKARSLDIAHSFERSQKDLRASIDETGVLLSEQVDKFNQSIGESLKDKSQEFSGELENSRTMLAEIFEAEKDKFLVAIKNQIDGLSGHAGEIENVLSQNISAFDNQTRSHISGIVEHTQTLQLALTKSYEATKDILDTQAKNLDTRADALRDSLAINSSTLNEVLANQGIELERRIQTIRNLIEKSDTQLDGALSEHTHVLETAFANGNGQIKASIAEHLKGFEEHIALLHQSLSQSGGALLTNLDGKVGILNQTFDNKINTMNETLTIKTNALHETIETQIGALSTVLDNKTQDIAQQGVTVESQLTRALSNIEQTFDQRSAHLGAQCAHMEDLFGAYNEIVDQSFNNQTALFAERSQSIQAMLQDGAEKARRSLETSSQTLETRLQGAVSEVSATLEHEVEKANALLGEKTQHLVQSLSAQSGQVAAQIDASGEEILASFQDIHMQAQTILEHTGKDVVQSITQSVEQVGEHLISATENAGTIVSKQSQEQAEVIQAAGQMVQSNFEASVTQAAAFLSQQQKDWDTSLQTSVATIEQSLTNRSNLLQEIAQNFEATLALQLNEAGTHFEKTSDNTINKMSSQIKQLNTLTTYLGDAAQQTGENFGTLAQSLGEKIYYATQESQQKIQQQNEDLLQTLEKRNEQTLQNMLALKSDFANHIGDLLNQIETTAQSIHESGRYLFNTTREADGHLNATVRSLQQNAENLTDNLQLSNQKLQTNIEVLQQTFQHISAMHEGFQTHTTTLEQVLAAIDTSHQGLSENLHSKQAALDALNQTLIAKSHEINEALGYYEQTIASALEQGDETTRANSQAMKESLLALISEATERFSEATHAMRQSADRLRNDLVEARQEMANALQTLPDQTQATTKAMRNAISDQIEALKQLTGIASQNTIKQPIQAAPIAIAPLVPEEATNASVRAQKPSWVSDLLARASQAENTPEADNAFVANTQYQHLTPRATQANETITETENDVLVEQTAEELSGLGAVIAETIRHESAVTLWKRYRRGRVNIHMGALYTERGIQIFEKIRAKYRADLEFKKSVQKYIAEFETILRDIAEKTNSNETVQKYLTTDTGKVYTMLAHASGRIQ
ncbi:hypothetical protein [Bartonella sp. DGB2]|uniref:apolipoprotein A-IV repeat region-like domain-containing protein n=1 Tax=Bartonella sp. DGB2 TaxID=3388426 RepID=UPI00398FA7B2